MATNPNELPFKQDPSGITYKLREIGKKACQDIRSESQHESVKDTLKILFKYADECLKDRLAEIQIELKAREERAKARAKFQHQLVQIGYRRQG
jgi:hypothetical protein